MYSSGWMWSAPTDKVFNGWFVVTDSGYLSDPITHNPYRVMPGDGIVFGTDVTNAYDSKTGVFTTSMESMTLEAQWDSPNYAYLSAHGNNANAELNNPNKPYNSLFEARKALGYSGTIFTNIVVLMTDFISSSQQGYSDNYNVTIRSDKSSTFTLNIPKGINLGGDFYFKNIGLSADGMDFNNGLYANGHRLIIGENVTTKYSGGIGSDWYNNVNGDPSSTHKGFVLFGGSNSGSITTPSHLVVQSGKFSSVFGGGNTGSISDSYISIGSASTSVTNDDGPRIFAVYGGTYGGSGKTSANTTVQVNSGVVMELLGGGRYGGSISNNTEVTGGYVSYLNGAQRSGGASVGNIDGNGTAVNISVTGGETDYLFGSVKDGNTTNNMPVYGDIDIKITSGEVHALFGGGYDFWETPANPSVYGDIFITITGGEFGNKNTNYSELGTRPLSYYDKEAGIYGGGYRGSVVGDILIKIGSSDPVNPVVIGKFISSNNTENNYVNVYGGGSGGADDSINTQGAKYDTTGKSYIEGDTKVVIGNATVYGDIYGGGKGVSKQSFLRYNAANYGSPEMVTDFNGHNDVAKVTGNTTVQIQQNAIIDGDVFGAGRGVSKSVYISFDGNKLNSHLYNIVDYKYAKDLKVDPAHYTWQHCPMGSSVFNDISGNDNSTFSASSYFGDYIRLKMTVMDKENPDKVIETIYSNAVYIGGNNLDKSTWESWNKELVQIAIVNGNSVVNVLNSDGKINGSVYGGGSYGIVGTFKEIFDTDAKNIEYHKLWGTTSSGNSDVNIQSGTIHGNIFGGGMGEPDNVTTGSVGLSSSVVMGNSTYYPHVGGNVYGGGENGFVGGTIVTLNLGKNVYGSMMTPIIVGGIPTNTYYFDLIVSYQDSHFTGGTEQLGKSSINIQYVDGINESGIYTSIPDIYGGGLGVNATVTGHASVIISGGNVGSIYGGGSLGAVGKLTGQGTGATIYLDGGSTSVILDSGNHGLTVNGSVYGGGEGQFTTSADDIILGSVGHDTNVSIQSKTLHGVTIKGSVLGGGKLGLVGNYIVSDNNLEFKGGEATVKVSGGTIYDNVFGGGLGSPYSILSGAVGKTNVIISGETTAVKDDITGRYSIQETTTKIGIGIGDGVPNGNDPLSSNPNLGSNLNDHYLNNIIISEGETSNAPEAFAGFNSLTPAPGGNESLIAVAHPTHGSIKVTDSNGNLLVSQYSIQTQGQSKYDIYKVSNDSTITLTYSDGYDVDKQRYTPDWSKYDTSGIAQPIGTSGSNTLQYTVPTHNSTIYVTEADGYTLVTVNKPTLGQINLRLNDGELLAPERDTGTAFSYMVQSGTELLLTYEAPEDSGYYAESWDINVLPLTIDGNIATFTAPDNINPVTVSVTPSNTYKITVIDPNHGTISVYDISKTPNVLIDGDPPLSKLSGVSNSLGTTYSVPYNSELMFQFVPDINDNTHFIKRWISSPLMNMTQAEDDFDIMTMVIVENTEISALEGPAIGNVYGGGAYGIVGNITIDLGVGANNIHKIVNSDNNASTNVVILGGKIGAKAGSLSTGNVFGGGYGPNAVVAGSTHVYIGSGPSSFTSGIKIHSLEICESVYGGGEMGSIGAADDNDDLFSIDTSKVSSNVVIASSTLDNKIIIGQPKTYNDLSGNEKSTELIGNVFGGGQGGDIPQRALEAELPDGYDITNMDSVGLSRHGYAAVYGPANVVIAGDVNGKTALGNKDSNIRIGSGVYGGGEGVIKGHSRHIDTTATDPTTIKVTDAQAIIQSAKYGRVTGELAGTSPGSAASRVYIDDAVITQSVFGGGKLGILGDFDESTGKYTGKDSIVYVSGFVRSNVFGGGEGHAKSAVSGAVGNSLVIIDNNAEIGSNDKIHNVIGPDGLKISGGNVYGGGRLSVVGDFTADRTNPGIMISGSGDNSSLTNVVVLGGNILNSVYGGGFSPKATVAGSTYIYVGDKYNNIDINSNLISNTSLCDQLNNFFTIVHSLNSSSSPGIESGNSILIGNIYGGGEMGSVGSVSLIKDGSSGQLDPSKKHDTNGDSTINENDGWVSANINIHSSSTKITIGVTPSGDIKFTAGGNIFGGGKGVLNSTMNGIPGYALIRGNTSVNIEGDYSKQNVKILGNVFGGGEGAQSDVSAIRYAEVYDYTEVNIKNATVNKSVYGGGSFGVIGHFFDSIPETGDRITITDSNGKPTSGKVVVLDEDKIRIAEIDASGNFVSGSDAAPDGKTYHFLTGPLTITNREFCGDDLTRMDNGKYKLGEKAYTGIGKTKVYILDSKVQGNIFGGGKGVQTNVLAGAVGRGTEVTIEVSASGLGGKITAQDNVRTIINGNVYGGGEYGITGSITTQITGEGAFSPVKVLHVSHIADVSKFPDGYDYSKSDLNTSNDVELVVNVLGGTVNGSIYGSGKGEEIRLEGVNYGTMSISYYKLSSFGRTEVNISNGIIGTNVYGGSQDGETGSYTVLQDAQRFTNNYWKENGGTYHPPSDVPVDVRDDYVTTNGGKTTLNLPTFSATFVNLIGGTIGGNVFGGGYYGAIYGTSHVHMGWNAMMPDGNTKGDCHYYNNYKDGNYGGEVDAAGNSIGNIYPFNENEKTKLVSNLFINGSVYAGGDRGSPDGVVSYDFITIYGTSHILLNGTGYAAGTNVVTESDMAAGKLAAMYVNGSLFGSGNSCTTFYDDIYNSRFITIKNYQAVTEGTDFALLSIQRASNITLINSKLRLLGRSDGANQDPTALYSLNHIYSLTLQSSNEGSSQIILDSSTKDLRELVSQEYFGDKGYVNTTSDNARNIIQLNGGITLEVKKDSGKLDQDFGSVSGYFYLDVDLLTFYNAYVYGQRQPDVTTPADEPKGGFVYGQSFYGVSFGSIDFTDSIKPTEPNYNNYAYGYRAWLPEGGGGHLTASSTVVATNEEKNKVSDPSDPTKTVYKNEGKITLPMTKVGSRYKLIGYNTYPSQIGELKDPNRSLILVPGELKNGEPNGFTGINNNTTFKLKISVGEGFNTTDPTNTPYFWFVDGGTASSAESINTLTTSGETLPQFNLELYSQGVTKTTVAGRVVLTIQEENPTGETGTDGEPIYELGNEISIPITIETQANTFGNVVPSGTDRYDPSKTNYEDSTTLYVNPEGKYEWQYIIPPMPGNEQYKLTLKNIKVLTDSGDKPIELLGEDGTIVNKSQYKISIKTNNVKNIEGWEGSGKQSTERFLTNADFLNEATIPIGTTDGRYQAGILITLYSFPMTKNDADFRNEYSKGTITFEIGYSKGTAAVSETGQPSSVSNPIFTAPTDSGTIYIDNHINTKIEIYTVSFVPGMGIESIPPVQINSGQTLSDLTYSADENFASHLTTNPPLKEGETFKEWRALLGYILKDDGTYEPDLDETAFNIANTPITKDTTLYAVYNLTVTFHHGYNMPGEGGIEQEVITRSDVNADGTVTIPNTPIRPGYTFVNWYEDKNCTTVFTNAGITKSMEVYAKWDPISYSFIFDKNERSISNQTVSGEISSWPPFTLDNTNIKLPTSGYSTEGYTLGGWSYSDSVSSGVFSIENPNDNKYERNDTDHTIKLYAVWTQKPVVDISFDKSGVSSTLYYYVYDSSSTPKPTPNAGDWILLDGVTSFTVDKGNSVMIKCELANDGKYEISSVTAKKFDTAAGSDVSVTVDANNSILNLAGTVDYNTTVSIQLKGQTHTLTLDGNGGTISKTDNTNPTSIDVVYGETYSELGGISADRSGYKFNGWYLSTDSRKTIISPTDTVNVTTNDTLIASYTALSYNVYITTKDHMSVSFPGSNVTIPSGQTNLKADGVMALQDDLFAFNVFINKGYTQTELKNILKITIKYKTAESGTTSPDNVLLTSDYTISSGTVDETTGAKSYLVTINKGTVKGDVYIALSDPKLNTYAISGFVKNSGDNPLEGASVTLTKGDGTELAGITGTDGKYTISDIPHDSICALSISLWGYTYTPENITFTDNVSKNITLENNLSVKYDLNGGEGTAPTDEQKYAPGNTITLNTTVTPTRVGYAFIGWAATNNANAKIDNYQITTYPDKDVNFKDVNGAPTITFYAVWEANKYLITFHGNGGTTASNSGDSYTQEWTYGAELRLTANRFTYAEHNFLGWTKTAGATSIDYANEVVIAVNADNVGALFNVSTVGYSGNMNLYALWEEKLYDISIWDILNYDPGKIATSNYTTYIIKAGTENDKTIGDYTKLTLNPGEVAYKAKVPAGIYNIYFIMTSKIDEIPTTGDPRPKLAKVVEQLDVGENKTNEIGVQLWTVTFDLNDSICNNKGSYELIDGLYTLLVVNQALPYQYNFVDGFFNETGEATSWTLPTSNTHYFDGWYIQDESGDYVEWKSTDKITKPTTIYAKWVKKELTVSFKDGSSVYSGTDLKDSAVSNGNLVVTRTYLINGSETTEPLTSNEETNPWYLGDVASNGVKDAGSYTYNFSVNSSKKIAIFHKGTYPSPIDYIEIKNSDTEKNKYSGTGKYTIDKLPIFIVPEAGQWKYYGYDLTSLDNFDTSSSSNSCIFIENNGQKYDMLQYKIFNFEDKDITATHQQIGSNGTFNDENLAGLTGMLYSDMLKADSDVYESSNVKHEYSFNIDYLKYADAAKTTEINTNYEIFSYNYLPIENNNSSSKNVVLSVDTNTIPSSAPTAYIEPRIVIINWEGNADHAYTGKDQSSSIKAHFTDSNNNNVDLGSSSISFTNSSDNSITNFIVYGTYNISIDEASLKSTYPNYSFESTSLSTTASITQADLTITISKTITFDGNSEFTFDSSSGLPEGITSPGLMTNAGDSITEIKISTSKDGTASVNAGEYTKNDLTVVITVHNDAAPNERQNCYTVKISESSKLTINPMEVSVTWDPSDTGNFTYTGEDLSGSIHATGTGAKSESLTFDVAFSGPSTTFKDAGTYTATASTTNKNYTIAEASETHQYTIKGAGFTASLSNTQFTYNGDIQKPIVTVTGANGAALTENTDFTLTWSTSDSKDANTYTVTVTGKGNYTGTSDKTYTINPMEVSVTWDPSDTGNFTYTGEDLSGSIHATGTGAKSESLTFDVAFSGPSTTFKDAGTYTATASTTNKNYTLTGNTKEYTIRAADENTHTVTFNSNGGSAVASVAVIDGGLLGKPADPTRLGYEFKGWYKEDGTEWNFDKDVVTADITLYAKWEPKDEPTPTIYKVEYNANGGEGEVPKAELHFAGEFVTVKSADLRKNGYTFKGWCDSVTQTTYQPDEKFRMPSRDVCLTAVWESDPISGKEVSVTFIVDNEIYGISSTHIHTALNGAMQADPVKEGFDFIGWYTKEGEVFTANTIVNNDMTVYAKFELNEDYVLVTYIIDNEVYMTLACKKTKIIEPSISAGMDKELNGWYTDKELQNKFDFNSVINEDSLTLYAEWKNNSNFMILFIFALFAGFMAAVIASTKRISFYENKNDEEKYASVIIIGKGTLKDRLPSHSNSNFEGWYSESGELITEDTEITQSMKVYARWKH